jgi:uncharacterized protein (DUF2336 family)
MAAGDRFAKLLDIARENSSERRRELLREVTDLFFDHGDGSAMTSREHDMFGDLLTIIAAELDQQVRVELAHKFDDGSAPRRLARALAGDVIEVAGPVLRTSRTLTDEDLIEIIATKGHSHQMVVAQRPEVSEPVSGALVHHGNDEVVESLLSNSGARLSPDTYHDVAARAESNPALQGPLLSRQTIPPDVLNRLYLVVSGPMRQEILSRNARFTEAQVAEAMARAEARVAVAHGAFPADFEEARAFVDTMKKAGKLIPASLPNIWREGKRTAFAVAVAELVDIGYLTLASLIERRDVDALAMICRGNGFDRGLFVTIAVLVLGEQGLGEAGKLGEMYNSVPIDAAQRALRFFKIRERAAVAA